MKKVDVPGGYTYTLPETIEEAEELAKKTRITDPFHDEISPSLLNKHDIIRYVSETGMIYPFYPHRLKSASYEVLVGNEYLRWAKDENEQISKEHEINLTKKDRIPLERNSITFVDVDANFYLPYYMALRFNLTITHVHRGILLGTGPLIDPGFYGKIMIPIHNLTNNDYYLKPGEPLIAVEFTKLTQDKILTLGVEDIEDWYKTNIKKKNYSFVDYLNHALPRDISKVESSIGKYIGDAKEGLQKVDSRSREQAESARKFTRTLSIGVLVGVSAVIIAATAAYIQVQGVVSTVNNYVSETESQFDSKIQDLTNRINTLSAQINKEDPEKTEENQMIEKSDQNKDPKKTRP